MVSVTTDVPEAVIVARAVARATSAEPSSSCAVTVDAPAGTRAASSVT
jgi:hypothetical protein